MRREVADQHRKEMRDQLERNENSLPDYKLRITEVIR